MKTLVIANQKGGVGKTAITVHLAWAAQKAGKKVVVIDLDTQANASSTLNPSFEKKSLSKASQFLREENCLLPTFLEDEISLVAADKELADCSGEDFKKVMRTFKENLQRLGKEGFDICLIDTPPSLGIAMAVAIGGADFIASPLEMEKYSIDGFSELFNLIENLKKTENENLNFLGIIPSKVEFRDARHRDMLEKLQNEHKGLILNCPIGRRSSVGQALEEGKSVLEVMNSKKDKRAVEKAVEEFKILAANIFQEMGI